MLNIQKEVVTKFYDTDGNEIAPGDKVHFSKVNTDHIFIAVFDGIDARGTAQFHSPDDLVKKYDREFKFNVLPKSIEAIYKVTDNE